MARRQLPIFYCVIIIIIIIIIITMIINSKKKWFSVVSISIGCFLKGFFRFA